MSASHTVGGARDTATITAHFTARDAAAAFLRGTTTGWGRRELATWLMCHYAPCVMPSDDPGLGVPEGQCGPSTNVEGGERDRPVTESAVEEIVREARYRVLSLLNDLADRERAEPLARLMIATGSVTPIADAHGAVAYVPCDQRRMGLADRVRALLVADYLNAPLDYRRVRVCRGCGAMSFAHADATHTDECPRARFDSHVEALGHADPEGIVTDARKQA